MANLTITVDEEVLLKARRRALDHGTSVNAVLRQYLESYAGGKEDRGASMRKFIRRAADSKARSRKSWTRDELHER